MRPKWFWNAFWALPMLWKRRRRQRRTKNSNWLERNYGSFVCRFRLCHFPIEEQLRIECVFPCLHFSFQHLKNLPLFDFFRLTIRVYLLTFWLFVVVDEWFANCNEWKACGLSDWFKCEHSISSIVALHRIIEKNRLFWSWISNERWRKMLHDSCVEESPN